MYRAIKRFSFFSFVLFLTSCAMFNTTLEEDRAARCKILNRQIIFNGATANQAQAIQERAQTETLNKDYRDDDCRDLSK